MLGLLRTFGQDLIKGLNGESSSRIENNQSTKSNLQEMNDLKVLGRILFWADFFWQL